MDAWFAFPYGPFLIFMMRVVDVSMGTLRLMLTVRGWRTIAAGIGFVEVTIWILAVGNAMQHLTSPYHLVGYAGGFAVGTFLGVSLERALALGQVMVRSILPDGDGTQVADDLRTAGYAVTEIDGRGRDGPVDIINVVVARRNARHVAEKIERTAPRSFMTIEEVRTARYMLLHHRSEVDRLHMRK
ncbi:DUF2179 domain-containing protein [Longibacter salinarum]|uniref:UPF0316 protein CRI94_01315 n=1 Tax=Longibacter salinarum TaxID=1850348 RepID=A0A2A8D247_9BACT|nr:DUF5698 domain-containing protein [Longibacter salinarum]PEN14960.1 DUF2179 domain-containing protein [Longibacter salinarum]